jgi:hypothetical protein
MLFSFMPVRSLQIPFRRDAQTGQSRMCFTANYFFPGDMACHGLERHRITTNNLPIHGSRPDQGNNDSHNRRQITVSEIDIPGHIFSPDT